MKTYRIHNCASQHRTERTFVKCAIRRLEWVHGHGPFAVISWCRYRTVTLHPTLEAATAALSLIDGGACGGRCRRAHELVQIQLRSVTAPTAVTATNSSTTKETA